jgi:hypothetical protein
MVIKPWKWEAHTSVGETLWEGNRDWTSLQYPRFSFVEGGGGLRKKEQREQSEFQKELQKYGQLFNEKRGLWLAWMGRSDAHPRIAFFEREEREEKGVNK